LVDKQKKRKKTLIIIAAILFAALLVALFIAFREPILNFFGKIDVLKNFILSAGFFAPLLFIILQVAQIIIAPIPGQVIAMLGGLVFGWWGLALSLIGSALGCYIVFKISRRFGRPLAEKIFKKENLAKFDYVTESKGTIVLFLIFILPFFPDDLVCYLAGLTKIPMKNLMIAALAGRVPGFLVATLLGMGLESHNLTLIAWISALILLIFIWGYWKRRWLHDLTKSKNHWEFIKETFRRMWQRLRGGRRGGKK
jgi:uncharacterized membrane protein YdjX (TVP38/TMEM64 family)